jgi:hypothetical protein
MAAYFFPLLQGQAIDNIVGWRPTRLCHPVEGTSLSPKLPLPRALSFSPWGLRRNWNDYAKLNMKTFRCASNTI